MVNNLNDEKLVLVYADMCGADLSWADLRDDGLLSADLCGPIGIVLFDFEARSHTLLARMHGHEVWLNDELGSSPGLEGNEKWLI